MKTFCLLMVLLSLLAVGCGDGGAEVLKRRSDLEHLGAAYREYHKVHQRAPSDASQLLEFMSQADDQGKEAVSAVKALEEGDILLIWNGKLDESPGLATQVLGFEAGVPARGGYVVMADGAVRVLKRGEFQSASMLSATE